MKNLIDGLELDTYNVFIPYKYSRQSVLNTLMERGIGVDEIGDGCCIISSRLFKCNNPFAMAIQFIDDGISHVSIAPEFVEPCGSVREESDVLRSFKAGQEILRRMLGRPDNTFEQAVNYLCGNEREFKWKFHNVEICHKLEDRFGLSETIEIDIQ